MIRRLLGAVLPLIFMVVHGGAAYAEGGGTVTHVVLVWLKEPDNVEALDRFVTASKSLATLPGVVYQRVGPSLPSDRAVVDSDFDVGVTVTLKDRAALQAYLAHPQHKQTIEEIMRPMVKKIVVYDFESR